MFKKYITRGNNKYAYLVESYREGGKVRQRTIKYLGKVVYEDDKEKIIPPRRRLAGDVRVKNARRFGDVAVLHRITHDLGLRELINKQIVKRGVDPGALSTIIAINKVLEPRSGNRLGAWYDDTALRSLIGLDEAKVSSENIGKLFDAMYTPTKAGGVQDKVFQFELDLWERLNAMYDLSDHSVVYDITSTYVYGTTLPLAARGYNRDGNHHPQYNIGLAVTQPHALPIHFKVYPGNVVDVSTIKDFMNELKPFGMKHATFVVDRGFYSAANLVELAGPESDVIGALPASLKLYSKLLAKSRTLEHPKNARMRGDDLLYVKEHEEEIEGVPIKCVVALNPVRRERERTKKMKHIIEIETLLDSIKERWEAGTFRGNVNEAVGTLRKGYKRCFTTKIKRYSMTVKRHDKAIQRRLNRCGKYVVFTTRTEMDAMELIDRYFEKDVIEKSFFVMKQLHDLQPTRRRLENRVYGNVFMGYLAYLLYSVLRTRIPESLKLSTSAVLEKLERVREISFTKESNMDRQLTVLTKKQKDIAEGLGMEDLFGIEGRSG